MSMFQMVVLAGILYLLFTDTKIKEFLAGLVAKVKASVPDAPAIQSVQTATVKTDTISVPDLVSVEQKPLSLSIIVGKWEELRTMCREYNLDEAENKLDEVFPLLLDDDDDKDTI